MAKITTQNEGGEFHGTRPKNRLFKGNWKGLEIARRSTVPERLQYPGRDVAAVVSNLFWSLHQYDVRNVTAEEMLDNTGFFKNDETLSAKGLRFKTIYLPYFQYSINNMANYVQHPNVWDEFTQELLKRMGLGEGLTWARG